MNEFRLRNIEKYYGKNKVLNKIDLDIREGEFLTLLGPSGCGKSTLLKLIAGLEETDSGSIMYNNENFGKIPTKKRNIGMVFQHYALFPNMTIIKNVAFGLEARGIDKKTAKEKALIWLKKVGLEYLEDRYPHELSGGQQQRVALARALVLNPGILLLDEPLSALDASVRGILRDEIRQLQQELGITTVYVTHDQSEALGMSDRIAIMQKGEIVEMGTPNEIYDNPKNKFTAEFIGNSSKLHGKVLSAGEKLIRLENSKNMYFESLDKKIKDGDNVVIFIKAEKLEVSEEKSENTIEAKVIIRNFLGGFVRYKLITEYGKELCLDIEAGNKRAFEKDEILFLKLDNESCHIYLEI